MRIAVQGIGVVGGFGSGRELFQQALVSGHTRPTTYPLIHGGVPLEIPAFRADTERLQAFVPLRALRRIDRFSRLGLLGAYLALDDAGVLSEGRQEKLGVIVATGYGATGITFAFEDTFIKDGDNCASPTYFANSVHNSVAANISILLGATGPSSTVTQFHLSVPSALQTAWLWLDEGRVDRVLFGAVDELSELIAYSFFRRYGLPPAGEMNPLRLGEESAVIGEGAAFFLLSRKAESRGGYCLLESVETGRHLRSWSPASAEELLIIGADGRRALGAGYAALAADANLACFTSHYGSSPAGPALDLAAAALMLQNGLTFPTPVSGGCDFTARVAAGGAALPTNRITCLTLGDDDGFGLIRLKQN
ncbi:MAG: beta-ketoacyl synthase [Candidatus Firestonebacteria bacterium]|nr:beta-ketoacyl synthase [Candidatus Firestonebacteria bacterium]